MKKLAFILLLFIGYANTDAQYALIDEWEASIGYLNMQGDFGQRNDFSTTMGNSGGMLGGKIYFNLANPDGAGKFLKFPLGFNTGYSALSFSKAYNDAPQSVNVLKIKAITGQVYFLNLSFGVEYHIADLRNVDYFSTNLFSKLDPYFGVGVGAMFYGVDIESSLGNYKKNPTILPEGFENRVYADPGIVPSLNLEVGLRFRISQELQLNFNNKWMYFMSDKVDGLVPDPQLVENKYNDWLFSPSIGIVIFIY